MSDNTLVRQSARELARLIRTRAVSPLDVLDAHLAAIKALNPKLNAVVTLAEEQARDNAQRAEQAVMTGEPLGALHGLPVGIKDITQTAGIRTTFASPLLKDNVPSEDEEVVRRLKAAGAIVLAKTNTPEFACGANTNNALFGPTRNPWNPALSPAGSSGGSAVAVATGMTALAQGTDYGCSIRIPAAFCGIVGIRPTPGLIPSYPKPLAWDPRRGPRAPGARRGRRSPDARCHGRLHPDFADFGGAALAKRAGRASTARGHQGAAHRLCVRHCRHRRGSGDRCDLPRRRSRT
jgi:amidase